MIRVVVADDHIIVRNGLIHLINEQPEMTVVAQATDGVEVFMQVEAVHPDVVIMDLRMPPGETGLVTAQRIKEAHPQVKILILTMHDDEAYVRQAFAIKVDGYLLKSSDDQEIIKGIKAVMNNQIYLDQGLNLELEKLDSHSHINPQSWTSSYQQLSKREQEILPLVALGYGNKEIAERLFISVKTVEVHKANFMRKLKLKSRVELVRYAIKEKIIDF